MRLPRFATSRIAVERRRESSRDCDPLRRRRRCQRRRGAARSLVNRGTYPSRRLRIGTRITLYIRYGITRRRNVGVRKCRTRVVELSRSIEDRRELSIDARLLSRTCASHSIRSRASFADTDRKAMETELNEDETDDQGTLEVHQSAASRLPFDIRDGNVYPSRLYAPNTARQAATKNTVSLNPISIRANHVIVRWSRCDTARRLIGSLVFGTSIGIRTSPPPASWGQARRGTAGRARAGRVPSGARCEETPWYSLAR